MIRVRITLKTIEHVVDLGKASIDEGRRSRSRTRPRPADDHDRLIRSKASRHIAHKILVLRTVRVGGPLDESGSLKQRHANKGPLCPSATIDKNSVLAGRQKLVRIGRCEVAGVAHDKSLGRRIDLCRRNLLNRCEFGHNGLMTSPSSENSPHIDGRLRYKVLTGIDNSEFCERVSQQLADGYVLSGSPSITERAGDIIVAQAVVLPNAFAPGPAPAKTGFAASTPTPS